MSRDSMAEDTKSGKHQSPEGIISTRRNMKVFPQCRTLSYPPSILKTGHVSTRFFRISALFLHLRFGNVAIYSCSQFRFADAFDKLLMLFGSLMALVNGVLMPAAIILFAQTLEYIVKIGRLEYYVETIPEYLSYRGLKEDDFMADTTLLDVAMCNNITQFYNGTNNCTIRLHDTAMDKVTYLATLFAVLGLSSAGLAYGQIAFWMISAQRQTQRIRKKCLYSILHRHIGWFDTYKVSELNSRLVDDLPKVQDGIGDKMGCIFKSASAIVCSLGVSFYYGWKLTLVILACCPVLMVSYTLMAKLAARIAQNEVQAYSKAGAVAAEVFGAIRTVVAFGGQEKECNRYFAHLDEARRFEIKKGLSKGLLFGTNWLVMFFCYALGFWYGGKLHVDNPTDFDISDLIIVFYSLMYASTEVGSLMPGVQAQAIARASAFALFTIIDAESKIDPSVEKGYKPSKVHGLVQLKNVHFKYPSRQNVQHRFLAYRLSVDMTKEFLLMFSSVNPVIAVCSIYYKAVILSENVLETTWIKPWKILVEHIKVLNNLSFEVRPGQTMALVGASGCGKSTIVQLLLRFYDPEQGQVMLDGRDVRDINIKRLRQSIGLVSQEPVLFSGTIEENIRYGRDDATFDQIIAATKKANAYDFISQLPNRFGTLVGERGAQLSGGQKQRIAIARALVRDPKILLLDEATSALDNESEAVVQDALDKARQGRTTIVVAHRLSTIQTADVIVGLHQGELKEMGSHSELMARGGIYHLLVVNQKTDVNEGEAQSPKNETGNERKTKSATKSATLQSAVEVEEAEDSNCRQQDDAGCLDEEGLPAAPFVRLMKMNAPEWFYILLGSIASIVSGSTFPLVTFIFSRVMKTFAGDPEDKEDSFFKFAFVFIAFGLMSFIASVTQSYMFACSGEALTLRIRNLTFRSMMRKDISWFDKAKNGVGALTTRLSADAAQVKGLTGHQIGSTIMAATSLCLGLSFAFYYGWKLAFVTLGLFPIFGALAFLQIRLLADHSSKCKHAMEEAGKLTAESIESIRTVAALSLEEVIFQRYTASLSALNKTNLRKAHVVGITYGFSQALMLFMYTGPLVFGGYMIEQAEISFADVFLVFGSVLIGAMGMGSGSALFPDVGKAKESAKQILNIIDSQPEIDYTNKGGKILKTDYHASITFKDVAFHYASRASVPVLQGLNVSVAPGQTLALVGSSGCGKSTSIQLIERFYDSVTGSVYLNSHDVRSLNIQWFRSQLGLVSQEPVLFNCSIRDNIAYGDNAREVSMSEIMQAAKSANVHNFIASLPRGYDTEVGSKGTQLSGGQKQRIAIARALVRNPKILLLDEATSALDTESEKIVQQALDRAQEGRTSIVIAHRLTTIQKAHKICVMHQGQVVEQGNHDELMAIDGFYKDLVRASQRRNS